MMHRVSFTIRCVTCEKKDTAYVISPTESEYPKDWIFIRKEAFGIYIVCSQECLEVFGKKERERAETD